VTLLSWIRERPARGLTREIVLGGCFLAYLVVVVALAILYHVWLTPDLLLVLLIPVALLTGRLLGWLRDWIPFVVLLMAWEAMRAFAGQTGMPVHNGALKIERLLFGGAIPTIELQKLLDHGSWAPALNTATTLFYMAHFAATFVFGLALWLTSRAAFRRYTTALLITSFIAFAFFLLYPTTPPWYASQLGFAPPVDRILLRYLGSGLSPFYDRLDPNPVAAFPSMHAAYPFIATLAVATVSRRWSLVALAWTLGVWFTVVYLGEHYVLDIAGGIAVSLIGWLASGRVALPAFERRRSTEAAVEPA
jgi:membrane-associated phospholipid phosphatase